MYFQIAVNNDDTRSYQCPGDVVNRSPPKSTSKAGNVSSVVEWLRNLGLEKYEEIFVSQEIDWDALQWLTDEVIYVSHTHTETYMCLCV